MSYTGRMTTEGKRGTGRSLNGACPFLRHGKTAEASCRGANGEDKRIPAERDVLIQLLVIEFIRDTVLSSYGTVIGRQSLKPNGDKGNLPGTHLPWR